MGNIVPAIDPAVLADGLALEREAINVVKIATDSLLGYSSAELPQASQDVVHAAESFLETHSGGLAKDFVMSAITLGSGEINAVVAQADAAAVAELSALQKTADAHLAALAPPTPSGAVAAQVGINANANVAGAPGLLPHQQAAAASASGQAHTA